MINIRLINSLSYALAIVLFVVLFLFIFDSVVLTSWLVWVVLIVCGIIIALTKKNYRFRRNNDGKVIFNRTDLFLDDRTKKNIFKRFIFLLERLLKEKNRRKQGVLIDKIQNEYHNLQVYNSNDIDSLNINGPMYLSLEHYEDEDDLLVDSQEVKKEVRNLKMLLRKL